MLSRKNQGKSRNERVKLKRLDAFDPLLEEAKFRINYEDVLSSLYLKLFKELLQLLIKEYIISGANNRPNPLPQNIVKFGKGLGQLNSIQAIRENLEAAYFKLCKDHGIPLKLYDQLYRSIKAFLNHFAHKAYFDAALSLYDIFDPISKIIVAYFKQRKAIHINSSSFEVTLNPLFLEFEEKFSIFFTQLIALNLMIHSHLATPPKRERMPLLLKLVNTHSMDKLPELLEDIGKSPALGHRVGFWGRGRGYGWTRSQKYLMKVLSSIEMLQKTKASQSYLTKKHMKATNKAIQKVYDKTLSLRTVKYFFNEGLKLSKASVTSGIDLFDLFLRTLNDQIVLSLSNGRGLRGDSTTEPSECYARKIAYSGLEDLLNFQLDHFDRDNKVKSINMDSCRSCF